MRTPPIFPVDEVTSYTYSSRGELLVVALPDGTAIDYLHDPLGRRIAKKIDGVITEKYLWQRLTRLLAVFNGSDNLLMRFTYADGRMPVAMEKGGITYYLTYDQVGSLRVVADASGNVVKRIDYDSFGNILNDTNPTFQVPFGFAGGLHDQDTGLVRFGFRDYDPDVGRWTAKDPVGFAAGDVDLYGYCLNDPINFTDPLGLQDESIRNLTSPQLHHLINQVKKAKQERQSDTLLYKKWLKEKKLPKLTRRRLEQQIKMNETLIRTVGWGEERTPTWSLIDGHSLGFADSPQPTAMCERERWCRNNLTFKALHHVMGRGIERTKIFRNKIDRNDFLDRLGELCLAGHLSAMSQLAGCSQQRAA